MDRLFWDVKFYDGSIQLNHARPFRQLVSSYFQSQSFCLLHSNHISVVFMDFCKFCIIIPFRLYMFVASCTKVYEFDMYASWRLANIHILSK